MEAEDIGRLIARLGVAVIAADGRITASEIAALARLDELGLGALADVAREEIERAIQRPIDVDATCAALPPLGEKASEMVLDLIAGLAASDGALAPRERDVFAAVARHLGVDPDTATRILAAAGATPEEPTPAPDAAAARRPTTAPEPAPVGPEPSATRAWRVFGLEPGAVRADLDAAYLDLVARYDPAHVGALGAEFAVLAVRRLAAITDAYEAALAGTA